MIKVGGVTEMEVKEKKDRVDDALNATRAAVEEGILPGGGVALIRSLKVLDRLNTANDDQKVGVSIVRRALQAPARQIAENAGEDGAVVVGKITDKDDYAFGFNAATGEYGNLVRQGVIDPAKVVRNALSGRRLSGRPPNHHRGDGGREAEEEGPADAGWRHGRHGRHGRYGLLGSPFASISDAQVGQAEFGGDMDFYKVHPPTNRYGEVTCGSAASAYGSRHRLRCVSCVTVAFRLRMRNPQCVWSRAPGRGSFVLHSPHLK